MKQLEAANVFVGGAGSSDEGATQPKYEQLRDYVVSQIESGRLRAGELLPSENRLAETLQIARSTVRQAMAAMERDGLVRRVHGKGTFIHEQARQRLRRGQDLFALIVPEADTGFYPSLQKSFEEAAAELHNQVIVCNTGNEIDKQGNSILQLIDLRVAGVAIVPTTKPVTPAFQLRQLQQHGIPVVCCSRHVEGVQSPLLAIPFEDVGRQAGEILKENGHRHVAFISGEVTPWSKSTEHGFRSSVDRRAEVQTYFAKKSLTHIAAYEEELSIALDAMFDRPNPPTAIFATFDSFAELIYVLLARKGLRVPEDVSILGFGGSRRSGALTSRLTSITLDEIRLGREAIDLLNRMRNGEFPIDLAETHDMPLGLSQGQTLSRTAGN